MPATKNINPQKINFSTTVDILNVVHVEEIGDFPVAVGGVITLAPNTTYVVTKAVERKNKFSKGRKIYNIKMQFSK